MIRRSALLVFALSSGAGAAAAQADDPAASLQALRRFVNRNSLTVDTVGRAELQSRVTLAPPRGCRVEMTHESTTRGVRAALVYAVDLARLSPEVPVGPGSGGDAGERTLELVSSDASDAFDVSITLVGRRSTVQSWRTKLSFGASVADEAARLFSAAIGACGGTAPTAEEAERIATRALHADGNDPETFPLKGRCLQMVSALVPPATELPRDSTLLVGRFPQRSRIEVSGRIGAGDAARRFSCGFKQEGEEWLADGANLAAERQPQ